MTEELTLSDQFLSKNGKRVYTVKEVKVGDILGITSPKEKDVRLSYVTGVHLAPDFIKFDYFPYAILSGPFIGFPISKDLEPYELGYKYASINPKHSNGRIWQPLIISPDLPLEKQEEQREFAQGISDEKERVYTLNDGSYKELGRLIPLLELPSLSFLPQSRDLEELVRMIHASKEDIEALKVISERLKKTYNQKY